MNEKGMTASDIRKYLKKEENYLNRCNEELLNVKSNIRCTKRAIAMWKRELKKREKKGNKKGNK